MGQTCGKARVQPGAIPFINLPSSSVTLLSQSAYEVAEGFGLDKDEVKKIVQISLHEYFPRLTESGLDECAEALFALFNPVSSDSKEEPLIDSFEFLATICIVSGMQMDEKIHFIFNLFDFSESNHLNVNEVTLAFRTIASGTAKISATPQPIDIAAIDKVSLEGFELSIPDNLKYSQAMSTEDCKMNEEGFSNYVLNCSETLSLLHHFDGISVEDIRKPKAHEEKLTKLAPLRFRSPVGENASTDEPWRDSFSIVLEKNQALRSISKEEPSKYPPIDGLSLDWVYGRNSMTPAMYCSNGDVIHAAGSIVVKITADEEGKTTQEYFMGHRGHVTSIDVFEVGGSGGDLVASADIGTESKICVWTSTTLSLMVTIPTSGISKLNFSPSGELLLALDNNELRSVAVYEWRTRQILFTSKVTRTEVYDCSFLVSDDSFGACTKEAVYFWTRLKPNTLYSKHQGVFNRLSTPEIMISIACAGDTVLTGSLSGRLWIWEGRVCTGLIDTLLGPIAHLYAPRQGTDGGLCVSTHGGSIHLYDSNLGTNNRLVPNKGFGDSERVIDTVCWHPNFGVLVGQNGNLLYQMSAHDENDVRTVTNGHGDIEGISMRNGNIITVGKNKIKEWDSNEQDGRLVLLRESCIEATLSCVSHNTTSDQIAVGFSTGDTRTSLEKSFVVLDGKNLQIIHQGCNSLESLTVCTYSNDGQLLCFGSADASIYIHQCMEKGFPLLAKARGMTGPVSHIDWGRDKGSDSAAFLRGNSVRGEAMFWTSQGKLQTPLSQRDTVWESQSCIYTTSLDKAHSSCGDDAKVTSYHPLLATEHQSIIVGNSTGSLRVFRATDTQLHSTTSSSPLCLEYKVHSGPINSIQVSPNLKAIYTMSCGDSCLFQWRHMPLYWDQGLPHGNKEDRVVYKSSFPSDGSPSYDMQTMIEEMEDLDFSKKEKETVVHQPSWPWTRRIVAPTDFEPNNGPLPDSQLSLERIHGYSGSRTRSNLHYLSREDCIIYNVGKVLVRYNLADDTQKFWVAAGEVTCLAVHQISSICAVGQKGSDSAITIVDRTMKPLEYLNGIACGPLCLDFDDSGKFLVSAGKNQVLDVYDWKNGIAIASCCTYGQETLDVKFLRGSSDRLVECGVCFVRFWGLQGCSLVVTGDIDLHSQENHTQYYSCTGTNGNNILVGTSTGEVIQFVKNKPHNRIKAHQSAVIHISPAKDGFVTSSDEGFKQWSSSMRCMLSINTEDIGTKHQIYSLCWTNDMILVGTSGNEIWRLSNDDGSNLNEEGKAFLSSHSSSPMGLSVHPNGTAATCGEDGILRLWNLFDHQKNLSIDLGMPARACAFSPDADGFIAVGFGKQVKDNARTINGKWIILKFCDKGEFQIISERRDSRKFISEMKWHSNGDRLAVGSWDKKICVYQLTTETKPAIKVDITLLSVLDLISPPMHFDFSRDGKYLKVNYECEDLHFFEAGPGLWVKESSRLKDTQWETETCVGWNVQGLWSKEDKAEIVSLDCIVEDNPSIVSGDSWGRLKMHQFPCTSKNAQYITYPAHLGPVGKVKWASGYVISTGENDNAVMIWRQNANEVGDGGKVAHESTARHDESSTSDALLCHAALYCDCNGQVVYPSSGNCVILDRLHCQDTQDCFQHDATVSAICSSSSRQILASSDQKTIKFWNPQTITELGRCQHQQHSFSQSHPMSHVSILSFSPDSTMFASVSSDGYQQTINVWMTQSGKWDDAYLHLHTLAGRNKIHFCHFTSTNPAHLVSGGKHHANFWSEQHSTLVVSKQFTNHVLLCGVSMQEKLVTGTSSGSLVVWQEEKVVQDIQAHNDRVQSLCVCPEGLVSGCCKGVVILWSESLQKIATFDVANACPSKKQCAICSIDITPHLNGCSTMKILVRMQSDPLATILEISCVTGNIYLLTTNETSTHFPAALKSPELLDC